MATTVQMKMLLDVKSNQPLNREIHRHEGMLFRVRKSLCEVRQQLLCNQYECVGCQECDMGASRKQLINIFSNVYNLMSHECLI